MDVDGVLTDGRIYYLPDGSSNGSKLLETKTFNSRDGLGIRLAHQAGLRTGILSGRSSPVVRYRAQELGIHFVHEGALEKLDPYLKVVEKEGLIDDEVCYVGDDLVDLPILKRVGLAVGVANGHRLLKRYVHYWTHDPGGAGAVRETIELILTAQRKFQGIMNHYLRSTQRSSGEMSRRKLS
jgi:3-deoxy-D-manno-octulosonate 8-phosphate phosphatase (KDO 8-P phosphatase)